LKDVSFKDGKTLSGWFVQNTDNGAIAFFNLSGAWNTYLPGSDQQTESDITDARITVPGGPSSFHAWTVLNGQDRSELKLVFGAGATPGAYTVVGLALFAAGALAAGSLRRRAKRVAG
jgi:hypothetical protein